MLKLKSNEKVVETYRRKYFYSFLAEVAVDGSVYIGVGDTRDAAIKAARKYASESRRKSRVNKS